MNLLKYTLAGILGVLVFSGCSKESSTPPELWVAMRMTKHQVNSPVPTDSGILIRDAETGDWKRFGPPIMIISSLVVDPSNPDTIFVSCGDGISRSKDGGKTWKQVSTWKESDVLQIAIDPTNSKVVYAATAWGVTISHDGGNTWNASNNGLQENFSKRIRIDLEDSGRLLLATTTGLFESRNQGALWNRVMSFPETAVMELKQSVSNSDLWLAATENEGVWISKDNGNSWESTAPALRNTNTYGVAINSLDDQKLAAGSWGNGVHISKDGGATWIQSEASLPSPNITSMVYDVNEPDRLWASTFEEGTFFSDDSGKTWKTANLDGALVFDLGFFK